MEIVLVPALLPLPPAVALPPAPPLPPELESPPAPPVASMLMKGLALPLALPTPVAIASPPRPPTLVATLLETVPPAPPWEFPLTLGTFDNPVALAVALTVAEPPCAPKEDDPPGPPVALALTLVGPRSFVPLTIETASPPTLPVPPT